MSWNRTFAWGVAATAVVWVLGGCENEDVGARVDPQTSPSAPPSVGTNAPATGGSDAGSPAADPGPPMNPCADVPEKGECLSPTQMRYCAVRTCGAPAQVAIQNCDAWEECKVDDEGARCVAKAGQCPEGKTQCVDAKTLRVCKSAAWQTTVCANGCDSDAINDHCLDATPITPFTAKIAYEVRRANSTLTDWETTTTNQPAQGLLVRVVRGNEAFATTTTAADGTFTVNVPTTPQAGDRIVLLPVHLTADKAAVAFAVGRPDVPDGESPTTAAALGKPSLWSWSVDLTKVAAGGTFRISEAMGSGAVQLHQNLLAANAVGERAFASAGKPVVAWLRLNTEWDCGACFLPAAAKIGDIPFAAQIWIGGDATNLPYWSNAVSMHEIGHWAMSSYSVSPGEGGSHCLNHTSYPGLSWSEGWATGFSSLVRQDPIYYDKQGGSMFWFDLGTRRYNDAFSLKMAPFGRPTPEGGLLQRTDENEIGAMVYGLGTDSQVGFDAVLKGFHAIATKQRPYGRGYNRHMWSFSRCEPINGIDTGRSVPMVADFLDALRCGSVAAAQIDKITQPMNFYPYPSQTPICQ